jgi:hypothetical protein
MLRIVTLGLVAAASGCILVAVATAMTSGCVVAPPSEVPLLPLQRPTILYDAVDPPTDEILTQIPNEFWIPVELADPDESFQWDVFVDYQACADPSTCEPTPPIDIQTVQPTPGTLDGGVALVTVQGADFASLDPTMCHRIDFLVAHQFNALSPHTWDSVGGDIITWFYNPGGNPAGCPLYDAGAFQDGAFPPADAATDGLPVIPESGTDGT